MLGLIGSQPVTFEPALHLTQGGLTAQATKPDLKGKGRVYAYWGGERIEAGVTFYIMDGETVLNHTTGDFQLKRRASATIRVIAMGQHVDLEIKN